MRELPLEPYEPKIEAGYEWSPKDDYYWDMKRDELKDEEEE